LGSFIEVKALKLPFTGDELPDEDASLCRGSLTRRLCACFSVDAQAVGSYRKYTMRALDTKLTRIGNSRGIRLPAELIRRHQLEEGVVIEEHDDHLLLKGKNGTGKLSWEETARAMAAEGEDWSEWEGTVADGLETSPWEQVHASNTSRRKKRTRANR
jgi:antitoxin component of MazEF toxin-antitoxin module